MLGGSNVAVATGGDSVEVGGHGLEVAVLCEVAFAVLELSLDLALQLDFSGAYLATIVEEVVLVGGF